MTDAANIHVRVLGVVEDEVGRRLAATRVGKAVYQSYLSGADPAVLQVAAGQSVHFVKQIGGGLLAKLAAASDPGAEEAELDLLADRRVLFALRNGESADATKDWVAYHKSQGIDGALIFDRSRPKDANAFARQLGDEMQAFGPDAPVLLLVHATAPMGREGDADARRPAMAPGAPAHVKEKSGPPDPWHAPFFETILLETLRRRFLDRAAAVAFVDVSDLLLTDRSSTVLDRAIAAPGQVIRLEGREMYPWRLRRGSTAPHHDHIYARINEKRWLSRWCVAPQALSDDAVWRAIRIGSTPVAPHGPARFIRAMGAVFPGAPVSKLVDKAALVEDRAAAAALHAGLKATPLRRPERKKKSRMKTGGVTIVTAMKNEGPYILDWLAHNRVIGVDNILVYSNDCCDGTDAILDALAKEGIVEHRKNPYRTSGGVPQHAAFRAAERETVVKNASWLLTLDVDEYIDIHAGAGCLSDLMAAVPDANAISMPWRLFGSGDLVEFNDSPVTRQFTNCAPEYSPRPHQAWGFKTLYQSTGLFKRLGVHRPRGLDLPRRDELFWVDGSGRPFPVTLWQAGWRMSEACWGYDLVTLNHYAVRSAEAFLVKRDRGRVNHVGRDQGLAYWFRMNHNGSEDRSIDRYQARVAEERQRLDALPGIAEAHANAVNWHRTRICELLQTSENQEFFDTISGPRMRRLSRMVQHFGSNVFLSGPQVIPDEVVARDPDGDWQFTVPRGKRQD